MLHTNPRNREHIDYFNATIKTVRVLVRPPRPAPRAHASWVQPMQLAAGQALCYLGPDFWVAGSTCAHAGCSLWCSLDEDCSADRCGCRTPSALQVNTPASHGAIGDLYK